MNDIDYMQQAIQKAREGIASGQTPFGACIVRNGQVIANAHNEVWSSMDITAHAEIQALRQACTQIQSIDLSGSTLYTTCEPCPMCFSACHWAGIERIVYGASIKDALNAGFNELVIYSRDLCRLGNAHILLDGGILQDQCLLLFAEWIDRSLSKPY